jgi:hypothetical protein
MKFKTFIKASACVLLLYLTAEILIRRLVLGQIPSQVPAFVVYTLLLLNLVSVIFLVWRTRRNKN